MSCSVMSFQQQNILPERGMMDFRDAAHFVGQFGAASVVLGDVGKLKVVKTEGICKNKC